MAEVGGLIQIALDRTGLRMKQPVMCGGELISNINAELVKFIEEQGSVCQRSRQAVERHAVHTIDRAIMNAMSQSSQGRAIECSTRDAFIIEALTDPPIVRPRFRPRDIHAQLKLRIAGRKPIPRL